MSYIQLIVQTERTREGTYRATAHRPFPIARKEYRGLGSTEYEAAEDAVNQLLRDHTSTT